MMIVALLWLRKGALSNKVKRLAANLIRAKSLKIAYIDCSIFIGPPSINDSFKLNFQEDVFPMRQPLGDKHKHISYWILNIPQCINY